MVPKQAIEFMPSNDGILDMVADAILVIDFSNAIQYANASACSLFGYTADEMRDLSAARLRRQPFSTALRDQIHEIVGSGGTWRGQLEFKTKSGAASIHDTVISPYRDSTDRITGMVSSHRNIPADTAFEAESALILEAVRSSNFGVTIADASKPDMPLQFINRAFENMTGYDFRDIVGKNCRFLQGEETDTNAVAEIRRAIQREEPMTTMLLNYRKNGSRFWNRLQLSPIHDAAGRLRAYMSVQIDITYDMTTLTIERERQKLEQLGLLASGIAHELNNALQPIVLMGEVLGDHLQEDQKDARKCAAAILRHGKHAKEVVKKILVYSRPDSADRRRQPLTELLGETVTFAREILPRTVALNRTAFECTAGLEVDVAETEFKQVFTNLLLNALQAMEGEGSVELSCATIELDTDIAAFVNLAEGYYLRIRVTDSGPGIPEKYLKRLFDPFFTTKPIGEGTGLGLSTAYGIVRDWGGTITAANRKGASFSVYVPVHGLAAAPAV